MIQPDEHFRLLVESATDFAIVTLDTDGNFSSWNTGAERLLGFTEQEAIGKPSKLIFTDEDREKKVPEQEMQSARLSGRAEDERWHQRKDKSRFWGSGVMTSLHDDSGVWVGYTKIFRDLTERKQMDEALLAANKAVRTSEAELQRLNAELEQRVEERTAELRSVNDMRRELLQRLVTAEEEERRRISRELHDQMGQQVTGLLLGLRNLQTYFLSEDAVMSVRQLEALGKEIAEEVHRISFTLRPTALDDLGLVPALRNYVVKWTSWSGKPVDMELIGWNGEVGGDDAQYRLSSAVETTIYRVIQEVLTNVSRHAATATRVSLVLLRTKEAVRVTLEDDGPGFNVEAAMNRPLAERRLGLFGMQERATLVGGTVDIESEIGTGTSVFLRIPLA